MILERLLSGQRAAGSLENPKVSVSQADAYLFGGLPASSGRAVTPEGALACAAVMACVRVLAESMGQAPCYLFERLEKGKAPAPQHKVYQLVHDQPNPEMTCATFKETLQGHLALRGNAYAEIERDRAGRPLWLWPLRPDRTGPTRNPKTRAREYVTHLADGTQAVLAAENVLHIPGLGYDGMKGYSPVEIARDTIGLALATEEHGARLFSQGAVAGGVLEHPGNLSPDAQSRLKTAWANQHQGLTGAHRIAVLEEGMKFNAIGMENDHAQFLESRKFSVTEVARLYRVPPHMIADLERATFSNIEQQGIEFTTHTLGIWVTRWEEAYSLALLKDAERARYYAEFSLTAFLRGDTPARYAAYAVGRQWGWLSPNEIRSRENMNPIDGGDVYERPLNMAPLGSPATPAPAPRGALRAAFQDLFLDVARGLAERDAKNIRTAGERLLAGHGDLEGFGAWVATYCRDRIPGAMARWVPALHAACRAHGLDVSGDALRQWVETWLGERARADLAELASLLRETVPAARGRVLEERMAAWAKQSPADLARRALGSVLHLAQLTEGQEAVA